MLFVTCARVLVWFCVALVLSTEIELRSSFLPSLTGIAGTELLADALGSAGGGAISAGLKSGSGGFDCFLEKKDLHVPDLDFRKWGSLRGAAEGASVLGGATASSGFSSFLFKVGSGSMGVVIDRLGLREFSSATPGVEWLA